MVVGIHHGGGVVGGHLAHAHVQRTVEASRKAFLRCVELVRRNAQVGDYAINMTAAVIKLNKVLKVPEVLGNKGEALVVKGIGFGILVLVESIEVTRRQPFKDGTGMAATAKGNVGVDALGVDVQALDALFQHDRIVIHVYPPYLMFSPSRLKNSSSSSSSMDCS